MTDRVDLQQLNLWPHQREAIEMLVGFLAPRSGAPGQSALVRMPTGTGKSVVIAFAAQYLVTSADVLVLTPWDVLVEQLEADMRNGSGSISAL
jgi:superfamily II DNA or RNA helicase